MKEPEELSDGRTKSKKVFRVEGRPVAFVRLPFSSEDIDLRENGNEGVEREAINH